VLQEKSSCLCEDEAGDQELMIAKNRLDWDARIKCQLFDAPYIRSLRASKGVPEHVNSIQINWLFDGSGKEFVDPKHDCTDSRRFGFPGSLKKRSEFRSGQFGYILRIFRTTSVNIRDDGWCRRQMFVMFPHSKTLAIQVQVDICGPKL